MMIVVDKIDNDDDNKMNVVYKTDDDHSEDKGPHHCQK